MKTTVSTYHHAYDVDLNDLASMIKEYADEVTKLEEQLESANERIKELEDASAELTEQIEELERKV